MKVRVFYEDGHDYGEFEYFSKYNRINAIGIKDEIKIEMHKKYGSSAKYKKIISFYRMDDED